MKNRTSLMIVAAACAGLLAAPAFAQSGSMSNQGGGNPTAGMTGNMKMKAAPMHKSARGPMHMASKSRHKMTCYDYAWESQDMKDCLAKGSGSKTM